MHFCPSYENTELTFTLHHILACILTVFRSYTVVASGELKYRTTI